MQNAAQELSGMERFAEFCSQQSASATPMASESSRIDLMTRLPFFTNFY
jgi:hypothetical protein